MSRNGTIAAPFTEAFRRRTAPNTGITIKMLARDTGYSTDTLERARDDGTTIAAALIKALDDAFTKYGFPGFINETYGAKHSVVSSLSNSAPPAASHPTAEGLGRFAPAGGAAGLCLPGASLSFSSEVPSAAPSLGAGIPDGVGAAADYAWWFTHEGTANLASRGLGDFARRYLDLPPTTDADPRRFVIDQLGWIAITRFADGRCIVDGNPSRLNQDAARRAAEWLRQGPVKAVSGSALGEGTLTAEQAAARLLALHPALQAGGWMSERLPESAITDPAARKLWRAIHEQGIERANFLEIADRIGALDRCAVFLIGDDITSAHVGSALRVDRSAVIGRPILARRDLDYARRLASDLTQDRETPTVREMRLDDGIHYRRLTFVQPLGRNRWQALTTSYDIVTPPGFVLA